MQDRFTTGEDSSLSKLVSDFLEIRSAINFSSLSSKNATGQGMAFPGEGGG